MRLSGRGAASGRRSTSSGRPTLLAARSTARTRSARPPPRRKKIASLATTRKLAARSRPTQLAAASSGKASGGAAVALSKVQSVDQRMRLECVVGFRQLRTCRRTRPGQLCARTGLADSFVIIPARGRPPPSLTKAR
jgi:hypothetical protein